MLARYKKPGGFVQILSLLESFGSQKREKFMEMILVEDAVWAKAIQEKLLSIDRIMTWPEQVAIEIFKSVPLKTFACAVKGMTPVNAEKLTKYLSHSEKRKFDEEMGTLNATADEIFAAGVKVIEMARKMIKETRIRLEKIDPDMAIPEDYEEKLVSNSYVAQAHDMTATPAESPVAAEVKADTPVPHAQAAVSSVHATEMTSLQKTLAAVTKENKALKDELRALKDKLEQIRKIA